MGCTHLLDDNGNRSCGAETTVDSGGCSFHVYARAFPSFVGNRGDGVPDLNAFFGATTDDAKCKARRFCNVSAVGNVASP